MVSGLLLIGNKLVLALKGNVPELGIGWTITVAGTEKMDLNYQEAFDLILSRTYPVDVEKYFFKFVFL